MKKALLLLFAFTPLALIARHFQLSPSVVFVLSALAIIPLAKYVGDATEELSVHTSPAISGLLNATLGNSTELIVGIFALRAGLYEVVKASITGSILGNLLLVLGTAIFVGGYNREQQKFNPTAAKAAGSMLLLATIALVIPAVFAASAPAVSGAVLFHLSVFVSLLMIMAYFAYLIFTLRTHKHLYTGILDSDVEMLAPNWSIRKSLIVLFLAVIAISFMSDELVNSISPLLTQLGWSQLFIGGIVIAIIGNVAEHTSAIQAALKNRMELALSISIGSATQIVMFVAPLLVLISLWLGRPMNLIFNSFELVALIFGVFVTNSIIEDGSSNWLEGIQLLVAYAILAVAFYLHP